MKRVSLSPRVVLLDWDGTLLNSYRADARAYIAMFKALEVKWTIRDLELHYSPNWYRVYQAARIPRNKWPLANRLWRHAYNKEKPQLLPGVRGVLKILSRDFRLAIVTSGSRDRVRRQLRLFELISYFSACVCSEDASEKKPHPAPLRLALRRLDAKADHCLYVGDSPEDIQMARRGGIRAIGVLGPFPTAQRIRAERPEVLLESIRELPRYLRSLGHLSKAPNRIGRRSGR